MPDPVSPRSQRSKILSLTRAWNYVTGSQPLVAQEPSRTSVESEPIHSKVTDSTKRRMLVMMTQQQAKSHIPRQQLMSGSRKGIYSHVRTMYEQKEAASNDLEARRRSIFESYQPFEEETVETRISEPEIVAEEPPFTTDAHISSSDSETDGLAAFQHFVSPLEGQLELRYSETPEIEVIDTIEPENDYPETYDYSIYPPMSPSGPGKLQSGGDNDDNLPIIIEHEFAPLYKDASGNLVRPPFINLDPRERHHLFQLKRLVEAAEQLQKRLKYMKNPHETVSKKIGGNKVETSTQTIDNEYLLGQLNIQKLSVVKNKRSANTAGFFSGHFEYEVTTKKAKFKGYLGKISKPLVDNDGPETVSVPKLPKDIVLDKEYLEKRDDKAAIESKPEVNIEKSEKLETKLGTSESSKGSYNTSNLFSKPENTNSSAFSGFATNVDNSTSLKTPTSTTFSIPPPTKAPTITFGDTKLNKDKTLPGVPQFSLPTKDDKAAPFSLTGALNSASKPTTVDSISAPSKAPISTLNTSSKPAFLFGSATPTSDSSSQLEPKRKRAADDEPGAKKMQFSLPNSSGISDSKPAFSFGSKPTEQKSSTFTFGKDDSLKETTKTPEFSFGSTNKDQTPQPTGQPAAQAFSFGKPTESAAKPAFSFGKTASTEDSKPASSSGDSETKEGPKPAFSFGNTMTKEGPNSAFSFGSVGSASTESKPSTESKLNFSGTTEKPTFGASKDSFTLSSSKSGTPPASNKDEGLTTSLNPVKPGFNFGSSSQQPQDSNTFPLANTVPSQSAPGSKETTPFSFQKAASEKPSSTPAFTFGKTESSASSGAPKPFTFGKTDSNASTGTSSGTGFTFGGASKPVEVKPSFNFGSNSNSGTIGTTGTSDSSLGKEKSSNHTFNFGTAGANANRETSSSPFGAASLRVNTSTNSNTNASAFGNGTDSINSKPAFNLSGNTPASGTPSPGFSFGGGSTNNSVAASSFQGSSLIAPTAAAPMNKFLLGFNASPAAIGSPAFGSTGGTSSQMQSAPVGVDGSNFGFNKVQTPKPVVGGAFGPSGAFTSPFGASNQNQFGNVNANGGGGSNPPLRTVTPGFNFGQQNVAGQSPTNGNGLGNGIGNGGANGANAFQPQMNPSILFSQTNLAPLQVFSAATPPPMGMGTGTPPLHRHGRQFAQARLRRR